MDERRRRRLGAAILALIAALAATAALAVWVWRQIDRPYHGYEGDEIVIQVEAGSDARSILDSLEDAGVLANATVARLYLTYWLGDPSLKAGEYSFRGALSTRDVLSRLSRGEVVTHSVTIVEGLTLSQTADRLAAAGFGDRDRLESVMRSPELIADLDTAATDLEGYLLPETYQFARDTSERDIVSTMVRTFRRRYEDDVSALFDPSDQRTVREVVTLASIVEREARLDEERPIIAGVYINRLRRGMPLQADPTVIYALTIEGRYDGNLRRDDLRFDSPYNTYLYPGLPPGPIASPGLASLLAAARPAEAPYLYFVSRNDGSHVFAKTLAEHNRNVHEWQKLYWRRRWAAEGDEQNGSE